MVSANCTSGTLLPNFRTRRVCSTGAAMLRRWERPCRSPMQLRGSTLCAGSSLGPHSGGSPSSKAGVGVRGAPPAVASEPMRLLYFGLVCRLSSSKRLMSCSGKRRARAMSTASRPLKSGMEEFAPASIKSSKVFIRLSLAA